MNFSIKRLRYTFLILLTLVILLHLFTITDSPYAGNPQLCTIFTTVHENQVYFAGNEDYHNTDLIVWFEPPSAFAFGSIKLGYREDTGQQLAVAMNDQGLAWDVNTVPETPLNAHPYKPFSGWSNFLNTITKNASTVEEVVRMANDYDFSGSPLEFLQLHVADATGDAIVLSPGADGEVAFTRKNPGDGYLISTNFNRAVPESGNHPETYQRYDNTVNMLEEIGPGQEISPQYLGSILEASHFESLSTYTLFSYVFDARNKVTYVYYMSNYDEVIKLYFSQELTGNRRIVSMADLVSQQTQSRALSKYHAVIISDAILLAITLISVIIFLILLVLLFRTYLKIRNYGQIIAVPRRKRWYIVLLGLAWASCFWAILLFLSHIYPPSIVTLMKPQSLYSTSIIFSLIGLLGIIIAIIGLVLTIKKGDISEIDRLGGIGFTPIFISLLQLTACVYLIFGLVNLFAQY